MLNYFIKLDQLIQWKDNYSKIKNIQLIKILQKSIDNRLSFKELIDIILHRQRVYKEHYIKEMILTTKGMLFTDVKKSLQQLLKIYQQIASNIYKLTHNKPLHINDVNILIKQTKKINQKVSYQISQRKTKVQNQLNFAYDVQIMLDKFLSNKNHKIRRHQLYSNLVCFFNLIISKVQQFIPKSMQLTNADSKIVNWKLFLSELNQNKKLIDKWIRTAGQQSGASTNRTPYKFSFINSKINTPSTAPISVDIQQTNKFIQKCESKIQKCESKIQKKNVFLKRCLTAKQSLAKVSGKKDYPIKIRCPSANKVISRQNEQKTSIFQCKINRRTNKRQLYYKFNDQQPEDDMYIKGKNGQGMINQLRGSLRNQIRKSTIVQDQKKQEKYIPTKFYQRKSIATKRNSTTKKNKSQFNTLSEIKSTVNTKDINVKIEQIAAQQKIQRMSTIMKTSQGVRDSRRRGKCGKHFQDIEKQIQNFQLSKDTSSSPSQHLQKQVTFKQQLQQTQKIRKHKLSIKIIDIQFSDQEFIGSQIVSKKSSRRNGVFTNHDIQTFISKIQQDVRNQEIQTKKQKQRKKQILTQKIMKDLGDISNQDDSFDNPTQTQNDKSKYQLKDFYKYLKNLKKQQKQTAQQSKFLFQESIFFHKQDILRQKKSKQIQEYILQHSNPSTLMGEIFDIKVHQSNIKHQNYTLMQRKLAFQSDSDWINQNLKQNNLDEIVLVQKNYTLEKKNILKYI